MPPLQLRLALLTSIVLAVGASDASALRYASPTGSSGATCQTVATACSLTTAITGSTTASEEIVVLSGNYAVASTITPTVADLHVHGVGGQPRPVITGAPSTQVFHGNGTNFADLDIEGSGELLGVSGGLLDRVFIRGSSGGNLLCQCYDGTIRNSVIVATGGAGAIGLNSNGGSGDESLINDTLISTVAATPAIHLMQFGPNVPATIAYTATNVIARNLAGGASVDADQVSAAQSTVLTLHHSDLGKIGSLSNGAQVVATDADITTAPLFADAAGADFHELTGSPTINAGIADPNSGSFDYDSHTRAVGPIDIGAFESPPPVVEPPIMPPVVTDPGTPPDPVIATTPTIAPPTIPQTTPIAPPPPRRPSLAISGRSFAAAAATGKIKLRALCTAAAGARCTITGTLRATTGLPTAKRAKRARPVTVGSLSGTLTAGRKGTLTLTLTRATRLALRPAAAGPRPHLAVTLTAKVSASGASRSVDTKITVSVLRAVVKHRKHSHQH